MGERAPLNKRGLLGGRFGDFLLFFMQLRVDVIRSARGDTLIVFTRCASGAKYVGMNWPEILARERHLWPTVLPVLLL